MDQLCLLSLSSCVCSSVPFISDSTVSGVPTLHRSPPIIDHRSPPIIDHRSSIIASRQNTARRFVRFGSAMYSYHPAPSLGSAGSF